MDRARRGPALGRIEHPDDDGGDGQRGEGPEDVAARAPGLTTWRSVARAAEDG
jgi:hypothetical protein